jgi:hypothetical protein
MQSYVISSSDCALYSVGESESQRRENLVLDDFIGHFAALLECNCADDGI